MIAYRCPFLCIAASIVALAAPGAHAKPLKVHLTPVRASDGGGVRTFSYAEYASYPVPTAPGRVTDIALEPGETLGSVASGDTARWVIGDTTSGTGDELRAHVLVKPIESGLATNLVITTDRRVYHLNLISGGTAAVGVSWTYPAGALLALQPRSNPARTAALSSMLPLDRLNFGYAIRGDKPQWRPLRAFDDGRQTYIEFPPGLLSDEAPPLFVIGADGAPELVNYRISGRHYVVDRLFDAAELRVGTKKAQVVQIRRTRAEGQSAKGEMGA